MDNLSFKKLVTNLKNDGLSAIETLTKLKNENHAELCMSLAASDLGAAHVAAAFSETFEGLSALELAQLLKIYNDNVDFVAEGVAFGFPDMNATQVGTLLLDPTLYPALQKADMYNALIAAGFSAADATAAVDSIYKTTFALNITGNPSYLSARAIAAYNFGTGDFSLQCWAKTTASGTVISKKPTPGGGGNGGFLFVIKSDGIIKFATDNGYGFYEINTNSPTTVRDGNWHFLTAVRQSDQLSIYVDAAVVPSSVRSNINPPVHIDNGLPLYFGSVAQQQEPFQQFNGQLDEVRIWNRALSAAEIQSGMNQPLAGTETGLVGYFTFSEQNGNDSSPEKNNASATGEISYTSPGVF